MSSKKVTISDLRIGQEMWAYDIRGDISKCHIIAICTANNYKKESDYFWVQFVPGRYGKSLKGKYDEFDLGISIFANYEDSKIFHNKL